MNEVKEKIVFDKTKEKIELVIEEERSRVKKTSTIWEAIALFVAGYFCFVGRFDPLPFLIVLCIILFIHYYFNNKYETGKEYNCKIFREIIKRLEKDEKDIVYEEPILGTGRAESELLYEYLYKGMYLIFLYNEYCKEENAERLMIDDDAINNYLSSHNYVLAKLVIFDKEVGVKKVFLDELFMDNLVSFEDEYFKLFSYLEKIDYSDLMIDTFDVLKKEIHNKFHKDE
ncbi:MAG: hypothetical protein MJ245_02490 [Clostridia bacterium]|nr:hypothetical protein [Clostridia bacterium]